jgi:anti-sigma-K factor RskA
MDEEYIRTLLPAYALGALEAGEAVLVERTLPSSPALRQELDALRAVVGELAYAAPPAEPPERVRAALLTRVESNVARAASLSAEAAEPAASPWRRWPGRLATGLMAALLLCVLGLGGLTLMMQRSVSEALAVNAQLADKLAAAQQLLDTTRTAQQQLEAQIAASRAQLAQNERQIAQTAGQLAESQRQIDLLADQISAQEQDFSFISAPGVATRDLNPAGGASNAAGRMYMRPGEQQAVVIFRGLRTLEPGKVYEFWLAQGKAQVAVGSVVADADGNARLMIEAPEAVNNFQEVMLTVEASGSQPSQPSGDTVLAGRLATD